MVKLFKNLLFQNWISDDFETWYAALGLEYYQIPSNDDPRLTFDLFTDRSNLLPYAFIKEKAWKGDFSESIKDYLLKTKE